MYENKKILILGAAKSGIAVAKLLSNKNNDIILTDLNDLNKDILLDILLNSNISPLKSFIQIGKLYDVDIDYTEEFVNQVVYLALKNDTGARGLLTIMNEVKSKLLIPIMTGEIESITLTEDVLSDDFNIELKRPRILSFN